MPTSDASWKGTLRFIGDLERTDHWHLTPEDECVFFGEYTARKGFSHSATNQIITNLKKSPDLRHTGQWPHKERAIRDVASLMSQTLNPANMVGVCVVPIPPSKPPGHAGYDDRMAQVARQITPPVDLRELLYSKAERDPFHLQTTRRDGDALRANIGVRRELLANPPHQVILLDDLLTTGCSFRACKSIITEVWPGVQVFGFFVARRVLEQPVWVDLDA